MSHLDKGESALLLKIILFAMSRIVFDGVKVDSSTVLGFTVKSEIGKPLLVRPIAMK